MQSIDQAIEQLRDKLDRVRRNIQDVKDLRQGVSTELRRRSIAQHKHMTLPANAFSSNQLRLCLTVELQFDREIIFDF